jgi:alcohol dehydrogenase YqhD (iron-dependent ADH family)
VLTIPATGSESSTSLVITDEETHLKRAVSSTRILPKFAILNPALTFSLPRYQIACGCSDILWHLMERYFTQVSHVDLTDRLLEAAMKTILWSGPKAMENPLDYDVRAEIMWPGTLAHNNLLATGRIGDWASHGAEHELSAEYDIAHGAGLSIVTPAWMKYVYRDGLNKFVQFAVRVFGVDLDYREEEQIALEGIARLERWYRRMELPVRLSDAGIGDGDLRRLADRSMVGKGSLGKFRVLHADDIYNIYRLAL